LGGVTLDIKGIAATPTVNNVCYVFVMSASYSPNWQTNYDVRQTTAGVIIEKAYQIQASDPNDPVAPLDVSAFTQIREGLEIPGYFWAVAYVPLAAGMVGKLIIGRGSDDGDELEVFDVDANGFVANSVATIDSMSFYGAAGALINTFTVIPITVTIPQPIKTYHAHVPHPVASGQKTWTEFLAENRARKSSR
jgi:hypothetical protein